MLKSIRDKKLWTDAWESCRNSVEDFAVLFDFFSQGEGSEKELDNHFRETITLIEDLEFRNMLSGEEDHLSAIVQIN